MQIKTSLRARVCTSAELSLEAIPALHDSQKLHLANLNNLF